MNITRNTIFGLNAIFLLSILKPSSDVGVYGLAGKFFEFLIAIPFFLSNSIYPSLLKKTRFVKFYKNSKKYLFLFITISFIVLISFWFLFPLVSLTRPEFSPAIVPLQILLVFLPFFFATSILQWILISQKTNLSYVCLFLNILTLHRQ